MDTIIERDEAGICPICKKELDSTTEESMKFVMHMGKRVLVCIHHQGVEECE